MTDQPGLFTADPRSDPEAQLIPEVNKIDDSLRALAGSSQSGLGIGGMSTKLQAAEIACRAGTDVVIAAGSAPDVIVRAVAGQQVGTRFPAQETPLENRKRWILAVLRRQAICWWMPARLGPCVITATAFCPSASRRWRATLNEATPYSCASATAPTWHGELPATAAMICIAFAAVSRMRSANGWATTMGRWCSTAMI